MSLSQLERETVINISSLEASLYTSQPEVWRRLDKMKGFRLLEEGKINGKVVSKRFEFPKSFVRFTKRGLIIASKKDLKPQTVAQVQALQRGRLRSKSLDNVQGSKVAEPAPCGLAHQEVEKEETHV